VSEAPNSGVSNSWAFLLLKHMLQGQKLKTKPNIGSIVQCLKNTAQESWCLSNTTQKWLVLASFIVFRQ